MVLGIPFNIAKVAIMANPGCVQIKKASTRQAAFQTANKQRSSANFRPEAITMLIQVSLLDQVTGVLPLESI